MLYSKYLVFMGNVGFSSYVFWFGDLNFRLNNDTDLSSDEIIRRIQKNEMEELWKQDQLKQVMITGEAFSELIEEDPLFRPTYKYNFNSQSYDSKYVDIFYMPVVLK